MTNYITCSIFAVKSVVHITNAFLHDFTAEQLLFSSKIMKKCIHCSHFVAKDDDDDNNNNNDDYKNNI